MFFVKHVLFFIKLHVNLLVILVGYIISLGVGHYLIYLIIRKLIWPAYDRAIEKKREKYIYILPDKPEYNNLSWLLGICERTLYTTVVALGFQQFIIYWLIAKVGASWVYAKKEGHTTLDFNRFMVGNTLSVIFGGLGGLIIKHFFQL